MPDEPYAPRIAGETLLGYAINRLNRGDTPQEAYWNLRRSPNFSRYSTQAISGAIRTAARLRGIAEQFTQASDAATLRQFNAYDLRGCEMVGVRIVFGHREDMRHGTRSSIVVNVPVGATKIDILDAARTAMQASHSGVDTVAMTLEAMEEPEIYAVLPGGYQGGTNLMDLPCP
jgi:hypothetical protein